jgi:hypothetical protein
MSITYIPLPLIPSHQGRGKCSLSLPDLSNSDPKRYAIYLRGWLNRAMEALT